MGSPEPSQGVAKCCPIFVSKNLDILLQIGTALIPCLLIESRVVENYKHFSIVYLLLNLLISAASSFILLKKFCPEKCFVLMTKCVPIFNLGH